ncbi:hypothetical protein CPB84DRAFT_1750169 [Gymnopilus junonius]|uniref:Uncharacterized protein n=1 Tax=Gymnopilus junonius TaxID=109634 RepID=A0A9P5TJY9_GYMJU|nr:hypothetical protein CPB84DRAFT_1750169 [Gymnopilus junonius]
MLLGFISSAFFLLSLAVERSSGQVTLDCLPFNFTLAALNTTLPNVNNTGAPLVLGQNGASTGIEFHVTSTYASYPYNDYPSIGLVDGTLRAYGGDGSWSTNATDVTSGNTGNTLEWITTTIYAQPAPKIFSAIRLPAYERPVLAAHGFHNLWSLCPFPGPLPQTNIIFNVSADIQSPPPFPLFDPAGCYGVVVTILAV